jgi:hypothetical protein
LARILFSEEWEIKSENLKKNILQMKNEDFGLSETVENDHDEFVTEISFESILPFYESIQNTEKCRKMRMEVLQEYITVLRNSRKSVKIPLNTPLSEIELNDQFSDSITLEPEIEEKSFLLFPSISQKRTKMSEILSWCGDEDIFSDYDNFMLIEAELKGRIKREKELWNILEAKRLEETRRMFAAEDREGQILRIYWENVENQLNTFEKAEPAKRFFSLSNGFLPGNYEYITDSTTAYTHGSGSYY